MRPALLPLLLLLAACSRQEPARVAVPGRPGATKTAAVLRAGRRAYDGAPPVIPHENFGTGCMNCHTRTGMDVPEAGFAPPMPHRATSGLSAISNCTQCHVFRKSGKLFRENAFSGLRQDLRRGGRAHGRAPPVMPHAVFMRENCTACHSGPAAREEIRCPHPERARCNQCHLPRTTTAEFAR